MTRPALQIVAPPAKRQQELFLQIGRNRYHVESLREAVAIYTEARNVASLNGDGGARNTPRVTIVNRRGCHLYEVSYNGCVWDLAADGSRVEVTI